MRVGLCFCSGKKLHFGVENQKEIHYVLFPDAELFK
jgi:hypothetical protein